jgi:hypothetical protein
VVTFVSQQKPTTRSVQSTSILGSMGLTECHEGQTPLQTQIAIALANNMTLATRNIDDFKTIPHLELIAPWRDSGMESVTSL